MGRAKSQRYVYRTITKIDICPDSPPACVAVASKCTFTRHDGMHHAETPLSVVQKNSEIQVTQLCPTYYSCVRPRELRNAAPPRGTRCRTRDAHFWDFRMSKVQPTQGLLVRAVLRNVAKLLTIYALRFAATHLPSGIFPSTFHIPVTLGAE